MLLTLRQNPFIVGNVVERSALCATVLKIFSRNTYVSNAIVDDTATCISHPEFRTLLGLASAAAFSWASSKRDFKVKLIP
jgi:hypothetical protein